MISTASKKKHFYLIFIAMLLLSACGKHKKVDVSNIQVELNIERFDHDFDQLRGHTDSKHADVLLKKYGQFYRDFIERVLGAGSTADTSYLATLKKVFAAQSYLDLKHAVDSVYPNLDKQQAELIDAFKHIKYYFPKKQLPKVYAYFSGFQAQTAIGNGYVGIGLDLFLGADSKFYPALIQAYPHYIARHFTPENMVPRVVEGMAREDMFPESDQDESFLQKMIYNGKVMYFMDQILPDAPDTLKIGYTAQQLKWSENFQPQIWGYFLENNLLYSTERDRIMKYFTEAPFTNGLGEKNDSSPKLGTWIGWQIVRQYMDRHPEVPLQQLMADADAQKILNESKYRPKAEK